MTMNIAINTKMNDNYNFFSFSDFSPRNASCLFLNMIELVREIARNIFRPNYNFFLRV